MSDFSERKWKKGFWVVLEMVCSLGSGERGAESVVQEMTSAFALCRGC